MNLRTGIKSKWCPGCTNFGILEAFEKAIIELIEDKIVKRKNIVVCTGAGCHAFIYDTFELNSFMGLHGRTIPAMTGMKVANLDLIPIGFVGDAGAFAEGLSHIIHVAKRNSDITVIHHNNGLMANTTGQFSPTTKKGPKTPSTPEGTVEEPLDPIALMVASKASFIARASAEKVNQLKDIIKEAICHKGFSFIDVLQPCITFNNFEISKDIQLGILHKEERPVFEEVIRRGKIKLKWKQELKI